MTTRHGAVVPERPFRIALGAQLVTLALIRGHFRGRVSQTRGRVSWREGRLSVAVRSVCGLAGPFGLFSYVLDPKRLRRAATSWAWRSSRA